MTPPKTTQPTKRQDTGTNQQHPQDSDKKKFEESAYSNGNNFDGDQTTMSKPRTRGVSVKNS